MLGQPDIRPRLVAQVPDPLPVAAFLCGKPVGEVAELMPRLFNLCRSAQSQAIRLALGLDVPDGDELYREIRGEHVLRLAVTLPLALGMAPLDFPKEGGADMVDALFGATRFPKTAQAFGAFLESGQGIAPVLAGIAQRFGPGEAVSNRLPAAWDSVVFSDTALENTVAARQAAHPVMRHIEGIYGRGPLWRVVARALDLEAVMARRLPGARKISEGAAVVSAARGLYAVKVQVAEGRLTHLVRMTPTDHLLTAGGIMEQSLATLPPEKQDQADLLLAILDPCEPVQIREQAHA